MLISIDTNVWIFGIAGVDEFCKQILINLSEFNVILPNQVRIELERNLSDDEMKDFTVSFASMVSLLILNLYLCHTFERSRRKD